jgi:hypothetical protein
VQRAISCAEACRAFTLYWCILSVAAHSVQWLSVRPNVLIRTGNIGSIGTSECCLFCRAALRTVVGVLRSGPIDSRRRAANIVQHASQVKCADMCRPLQ